MHEIGQLTMYVLWRDSNDKLSASRSLSCLSSWAVGQQFYVGPDRFVVYDVFISVFWWMYYYNIVWTKAHVPI